MRTTTRATRSGESGHRLVLVENADHFNLRSPQGDGGGVLRGLLLAWFNAAAQAPAGTAPQLPAGGWGSSSHPLRGGNVKGIALSVGMKR